MHELRRIVGFLGQYRRDAVIGILFVVAAGIGAERTGARVQAETPPSARVDGPGDPGYVVP